MMARAHPKLAMRPMLPTEAPLVAEIFRASIEELTGDDYSATQQEAWASVADDVEEFGARLPAFPMHRSASRQRPARPPPDAHRACRSVPVL